MLVFCEADAARARRAPAEHFDNAELVSVDDSRTLIPIDQPEVLTAHLEEFLARTTTP